MTHTVRLFKRNKNMRDIVWISTIRAFANIVLLFWQILSVEFNQVDVSFHSLVRAHTYLNLRLTNYQHLGSVSPTYLRTAFTPVAPKCVRIQASCQYLFTLLGSTGKKAARITLMKLTPGEHKANQSKWFRIGIYSLNKMLC